MVALSVLYRPAHGHVPCDIRQLVSDVVTAPRPAEMMALYPALATITSEMGTLISPVHN